MSKVILQDIGSGFNLQTVVNNNNDFIEQAFDRTLSRDGQAPNGMLVPLDMNSKPIINLGTPYDSNSAARLIDVTNLGQITGTAIPSQSGNADKALYTDGTNLVFRNVGFPATAAELDLGVTIVNQIYIPGDIRRYKTGALTATVSDDWTTAIQAAMDCNSEVYFPDIDAINGSFFGLSSPLYIKEGTIQNLTLIGLGRTNTYLHALNVSIADGLGINALIINQANNGKFSMRNMRFWSSVAYTGVGIYAVENGLVSQAIFSGSIDNCWFGLGSTNSGVLQGGFNNYRITNNVWETAKTCITLEGNGNADIFIDNNQLFSCYDEFVKKTDLVVANLITITNTHIYGHQRGQVINLRQVYDLKISNISLQMALGNLGNGGLFNLRECYRVLVTGFDSISDTPFGTGATTEVITLQGVFGKFTNGYIDGSDKGIHLTGNDANKLNFVNLDVINTITASFWVQTGAPTGRVQFDGCNLADGQLDIILTTSAGAFDLIINDSRVMNAGLGGSPATRTMSINTTGRVRINNCEIGFDNVSAVAPTFIDASGSGTFEVTNCEMIGTPITSIKAGAQLVKFRRKPGLGVAITAAATITLPFNDDVFPITGNTNITSITAANCEGRRITLVFSGTPTLTDGSNLKLPANFVATADDAFTLVSDGTNWYAAATGAAN